MWYKASFQCPDTGLDLTGKFVAGRFWVEIAEYPDTTGLDEDEINEIIRLEAATEQWVDYHHGMRFRSLDSCEFYLDLHGADVPFEPVR